LKLLDSTIYAMGFTKYSKLGGGGVNFHSIESIVKNETIKIFKTPLYEEDIEFVGDMIKTIQVWSGLYVTNN
jgi:hypothetical protein